MAIEKANFKMTSAEIKKIVKELDYADNKKINYSEFLAATIDTVKFLNDQKMEAIFKSFDIDNTGSITVQNLKDSFSKFGRELSDDEIKEVMKEHDLDKGNSIDYHEFRRMMTGRE